MLTKDRIVFDPTDAVDSDNIGAYVRDASGALITSTLISGKQGLDVNVIDPITVTIPQPLKTDPSSNTAMAASAATVTTTVAALLLSPLANRKTMIIQNLGGANIFVGPSGVTATTGLRISAGSVLQLDLGPAVSLFAVAMSGSQNVRVLELA